MFQCSFSPQEPVFHTKCYPCRLSAWQTLSGLLLCWLLNTGHCFQAQMTRPSSTAFPMHGYSMHILYIIAREEKVCPQFCSRLKAQEHSFAQKYWQSIRFFSLPTTSFSPWTLHSAAQTLQHCKMKAGTGTISRLKDLSSGFQAVQRLNKELTLYRQQLYGEL